MACTLPRPPRPAGRRLELAPARRLLVPGRSVLGLSVLGIAASPHVRAHNDYNEITSPTTAQVWAEHSVWPQGPGFQTALAGGVTTLHVLPGSANLIGGRTVVLRNVPATSYREMKFPDAPQGLKMACGENPKSVYGKKGAAPSTRMAEIAEFRQAFADAQEYQRQWQKYRSELANFERKKTKDAHGDDGNWERKHAPVRSPRTGCPAARTSDR